MLNLFKGNQAMKGAEADLEIIFQYFQYVKLELRSELRLERPRL